MSTTKRVLGGALASLVGVAAALFLGAAPAYADNGPHVRVAGTPGGGQLVSELQPGRCTACHRIHTAKSADGMLLKTEQVSLCYSCHGDGGTGAITNVQSGIAYSGAVAQDPVTGQWATAVRGGEVGALRGGGFDRAMIDAGAAKQASGRNDPVVVPGLIPAATVVEGTSGNHMGGQGIVWGSGPISQAAYSGQALPAGVQLECGSCHDPHGNGNYRILKAIPDFTPGTTAEKTARAITIPDTTVKVYTTTNYWFAGDTAAYEGDLNVRTTTALQAKSPTEPTPVPRTVKSVDKYLANVAAWCTTCHTRYLANASGTNLDGTRVSAVRSVDSGDAIFTYRHSSDHIDSEYGKNRNCITCHVAHGSNATMSGLSEQVEWPGTNTLSDDNRLLRVDNRGVCLVCHNV